MAWTRRQRRQLLVALAFLLPNLLGFLAFTFGPVIASFVLSLFRWDVLRPPVFVDLGNYVKILSSGEFYLYLWNTVFFLLAIPLGMAVSLALALALNRSFRGRTLFRTVFFLPVISPFIAVALLWTWLYDRDFGLVNQVLTGVGFYGALKAVGIAGWLEHAFHITVPFDWLGNPHLAKLALVLMSVWKSAGYDMLLFLAALQGIPEEYYEAATIDGAGAWKQFRHVTWPLLAPTSFFVVIMGVIGTFQIFGPIYIMTEGGPAKSTTTLAYEVYSKAFNEFQMGYASSYAWILFLLMFAITLVQWRYVHRRVHYGA